MYLFCTVYSIFQSLDNFGCPHLSVEGPNTCPIEKEVLLLGITISETIQKNWNSEVKWVTYKMGHVPLYQGKLQKIGRSLLWHHPVRYVTNGVTLKNQHKLCNCAIMKLAIKQPNLVTTHIYPQQSHIAIKVKWPFLWWCLENYQVL